MTKKKYQRTLALNRLIKHKSLFLFGPRSTGKTTLLNALFGPGPMISLLSSDNYLALAQRPAALKGMIKKKLLESQNKSIPLIIIDEIQKLPSLLDEVHALIEEQQIKFILTGSSARKIKVHGVNLLAGRAWQTQLFPLTWKEISDEDADFDLEKYLAIGGLPQVWTSEMPHEELDAYVSLYLQEEIKEEALVQQLHRFAHFLKVASTIHGEVLNFQSVAMEAGIPATTIKSYFSILEETFMGYLLHPWGASKLRKSVATAKFYFFDLGVASYLAGQRTFSSGSVFFGKAFEHFIINEVRAYLSYQRIKLELTFWRTYQQQEVDLLIGDQVAIEIKSAVKMQPKHLKGLKCLREEQVFKSYYLVSLDPVELVTADGIEILNWESFMKKLWAGKILSKNLN